MDPGASSQLRPRTRVACVECRKNKRKCNGDQPSCSLCEKSGKLCMYTTETQKRKRKQEDEEHIRSLEEEIKTLKSELDFEKSKNKQDKSTFSTTSPGHQFEAIPSCQDSIGFRPDRAETSGSNSAEMLSPTAMEELGSLMLNLGIEDEGEPSFTLASGKVKPINSAAIVALPPHIFQHSTRPSILDDRQTLLHLIDCFLEHFNPHHELLDQAEIHSLKYINDGNQRPDKQFRDSTIYSIGARFSDRPGRSDVEEALANFAEQICTECLRDYPSALVVQGVSLLAWRELMAGNNSMSFTYNSIATGLALRLGLHVTSLNRELSDMNEQTQTEYILRVRTFWTYFSIDRIITANIGMNCTMPWQRVRVTPFINILDRVGTIDEIAFDRQVQLWHLWDSLMDQVLAFNWRELGSEEKQTLLVRSRQALLNFHRDSDERLRIGNENSTKGVLCFRMAFQTALLLIHRPFIYEPTLGSLLKLAVTSATAAANSITRLVREYNKIASFKNAPPELISHISSAAVVHLLNATAGKSTLGRKSSHKLAVCLDALLSMQSTWDARISTSILFLQELAHRWKVVWALPLSLSSPLPSTIIPQSTAPSGQSTQTFQNIQNPMNSATFSQGVGTSYEPMNIYEVGLLSMNWLFDETGDAVNLTGWDQNTFDSSIHLP